MTRDAAFEQPEAALPAQTASPGTLRLDREPARAAVRQSMGQGRRQRAVPGSHRAVRRKAPRDASRARDWRKSPSRELVGPLHQRVQVHQRREA